MDCDIYKLGRLIDCAVYKLGSTIYKLGRLMDCAIYKLGSTIYKLGAQFINWAPNLSISRLRRLIDCAEHIHLASF